MVIGIAGKTGAGKNRVAELLLQQGWRALDLDLVAHEALDALAPALKDSFGPSILKENRVDRRALGQLVFQNGEKLKQLEKLTYPWIEKACQEWVESQPSIPAAVHGVNLHKTAIPEHVDAIIWVYAPYFQRKKRVMKRDQRCWKELKGRFRQQKRLSPKLFSSRADIYIVRNSQNVEALEASLERALRRMTEAQGIKAKASQPGRDNNERRQHEP
ncbi:MAG: dephospho-CoA kinase [Spirochaetales bacterium]|nr:dephospho-CoA kinase [Spirochaetales bacterium]